MQNAVIKYSPELLDASNGIFGVSCPCLFISNSPVSNPNGISNNILADVIIKNNNGNLS